MMGNYTVRCVRLSGLSVRGFFWPHNESIDLLAPGTPEQLRAADYDTAHRLCTDTTYDLAQHVQEGDLEIVSTSLPNYGELPPWQGL